MNERKEDIPDLAAHFIELYNRKTGKKIEGISTKAKEQLMAYHWPGNIRELEHVIERSILLAKDTIIEEVLISRMKGKDSTAFVSEDERIKDHPRKRARSYTCRTPQVQRQNMGIGAAELLNIPPSTLKSKMKKLGIVRQYIEIIRVHHNNNNLVSGVYANGMPGEEPAILS